MKTTFKLILTSVAAIGLSTFMIACGNKNNNDQQQQVIQSCYNCGSLNMSQSFFNSQSQDFSGNLTMNLNFMGSIYNTGYGSPVINYNGSVAATGNLNVVSPIYLGYCVIPAGGYTINTVQAGRWSSAIVSNLRLQAVSTAGSVMLTIMTGQVSAKTGYQLGYTWNEIPQTGRLFANVLVESVNGYSCQNSVLMQ